MTHFQALYGQLPPLIPTYTNNTTAVHEVDLALQTRDELLQQLKHNLQLSINRMKQYADNHRRDLEFAVRDQVLLKLHPCRHQSVFKRAHKKLASRYYGPFIILEKMGFVAYKLQLPDSVKIHLVFDISLLKPYIGMPLDAP